MIASERYADRLIRREELIASLPNAITFEKQPVLLRKFMELFSLSSGPQNAGERMGELLCCLPQVPIPAGLGWMVRPFVESIPRESLEFTLDAMRTAVVGSGNRMN